MQLRGGCGQWWQWWRWLRVPHRLRVPEQRADRSRGPCTAGGGIVTVSMCSVGLVSMETTGLTPLDSSTSFAQSSGVGVRFVGSSSVGCASVHFSLVVPSSFAVHFSGLSRVVIFAVPNVASSRRSGISAGGFAMVSGSVFRVFSSSLVLTFAFRSFSIPSTSFGNGMPSSFGHLCRRRRAFSSICSSVTVTGLHQ